MKRRRQQTVGKIHFIIESHYKQDAVTAKELLSRIMVGKAQEALRDMGKAEPTPVNI